MYLTLENLKHPYRNQNKHLRLIFLSFFLRLEDVYIGILADIYKSRINDIRHFYIPNNQYSYYSTKDKTDLILKNGVKKTLFIYEHEHFSYYWNFTLSSMHIKNNF